MNSCTKGKVGEREAAHFLNDLFGRELVRRGRQYSGSPESPDVVGISGIHFEVKRVEQIRLEKAMQQSVSEAGLGEVPVVMHRKNNSPWLITIRASDAPAFAAHIQKLLGSQPVEA